MCFNSFLPVLGKALNNNVETDIDIRKVAFIPNFESIFEEKYSMTLQDHGTKGWSDKYIKSYSDLYNTLMLTYWFRKHLKNDDQNLRYLFNELLKVNYSIIQILALIKQAIVTIDG